MCREPIRLFSRSLTCVPSAIAARPRPQCRGNAKRAYWSMTSTIAASSLSALICCALIRRSACAVAGVLVDNVDHRGFQLVGVDLLRVDPAQRLRGCESGRVTRGLAWTKVAAITEDGEQIA